MGTEPGFFRIICALCGVVSNLEKMPIRIQSFLSATSAEGKVGLNQSDHLVKASNRMHIYEVRLRKDRRGFDLISDVRGFGRGP